jgi:prepilin-type N-terminal cleavage/methylation domain-containing protein
MKAMGINHGPQEGFTLLEVLVATVVLGASVAALFSLLSGSLTNARRLQAPEQAVLMARSQLNALLAASEQGRAAEPALPLDQRVRGRWNDQFRWEAQASKVPTSRPAVPGEAVLVRIEFDAYWNTGQDAAEKQLSLETYQLWQERGRATP